MANPVQYQAKEVLNKVLNTDGDALNVDLHDVTLTTEGGDVAIDVELSNATDDVLVYGFDGSANQKIATDSSGQLQVDILTSALPSGAATAANQATIIGHVDGIEALLTTIDADTDAIKTAVQILDDWDDSNYANVNINLAGVDAPTGGGAEAGSLRVTIANDSTGVLSVDDNGGTLSIDDGGGAITVDGTVTANLSATDNAVLDSIDSDTSAIKTAVEIIDNAIDGSEMQVDIISSPTNSATVTGQSSTSTSYAALTGSNLTTDNQGLFSYEIRITGTDNCTLKVQGSNDNSNWVDDDMDEVTIATGASGLISGTSFFKYIRLQFKSSATNGTTVNAAGFAK